MVAVTRVVVVQIQELVVSFISRLNLALMVGCTLISMGMKSAASTHTPPMLLVTLSGSLDLSCSVLNHQSAIPPLRLRHPHRLHRLHPRLMCRATAVGHNSMDVTMTMAAIALSIVAETTTVTAVGHNNGAAGQMMAVGVSASAVISLQPTVL